ncbi:MAG: transposase [cyanobacterium endosymbiont of Rhopalodia sterrenbergii]
MFKGDPDLPFYWHPLKIGLSLDKFFAISDGELVYRPRFLKKLHCNIKLLQFRLRNKQKGFNNRYKLDKKIARLYQRISDTRKGWHFKLVPHLCDQAKSVFINNIDFRSWGRRILFKDCLKDGFKLTVTILKLLVWKRNVFIYEIDKNLTSQIHINYEIHTSKKPFDVRKHNCPKR